MHVPRPEKILDSGSDEILKENPMRKLLTITTTLLFAVTAFAKPPKIGKKEAVKPRSRKRLVSR